MSEVNGPKISVNQIGYAGIQKQVPEQPEPETTEQTPQLTDYSDNKAESLGRSMLFKGTDNTSHDLEALLKNPQIAENSDEIFEKAYNAALTANVANPYEEAATASTTSM